MAQLVDSEGWISDESSFYGDEDQKAEWEKHVERFDPLHYLSQSQHDPNKLAAEAAAKADREALKAKDTKLYNRYKGDPAARQLTESVEDFVARLPPSTTKQGDNEGFIWIANPYDSSRITDGADFAGFKDEGAEILEDFEATRKAEVDSHKRDTKATVDKVIEVHRKETVNALLESAKTHRVLTGKWMLFPLPENVDRQWRVIAEATAKGRLGVSAKVAVDAGKGERVARLICVYTKDFLDKEDVKRTLLGLLQEGLVQRRGPGQIYYKIDAWTHLGIESRNQWEIRPWLYASNDLLKEKK